MRSVIAFAVIAIVAFVWFWRGHDGNSEASTPAVATPSPPRGSAPTAGFASPSPRMPSSRPALDTAAVEEEAETPTAPPYLPAQPLPPAEAIRHIQSELAASGPATGAAWESQGYETMQTFVRDLATVSASASVTDYRCHAAGCAAEVVFATPDDHDRARESLISAPAMRAWPGPRVISPTELDQGRVRVLVVLTKPPL